MIDDNVLKEFADFLIKIRYKNVLKELKLDTWQDDDGMYICLNVILIKKSARNKGNGSLILKDIVQFADLHNVRVKLYCTNLYGADLQRLYKFYERHGFVLIKKDNDGHMIYFPNKV
jgi:GNAT superfamily N-acetyltransferase